MRTEPSVAPQHVGPRRLEPRQRVLEARIGATEGSVRIRRHDEPGRNLEPGLDEAREARSLAPGDVD